MKLGPRIPARRAATIAAVLAVLLPLSLAVAGPIPKTSAARRGLTFSHATHEKNGMECSACHAAETSKTGSDDLLPRHAACSDCHDVTTTGQCNFCHQSDKLALSGRVTTYSAKFNHEAHRVKGKLTCGDCHQDLNAPLTEEKSAHLPAMAECMNCHERRQVKQGDCSVCHLSNDDLVPLDHKLEWMARHGASAHTDESCRLCHQSDDCQQCHSGDPVFMPHPRNYVGRHGPDAHLSDVSCSVCHDQRRFCNECHRRMNVLPAGHFRAGWLTPDGGDHAERAAFDLESCMACHEQGSHAPTCERCHEK